MAALIDNTDAISKTYMSCYKFDHGNSSEVSVADSSTRQVSRIFNQSLSAEDVKISNTASQPLLCTKQRELITDISLNLMVINV